jgi:hypothetical protein
LVKVHCCFRGRITSIFRAKEYVKQETRKEQVANRALLLAGFLLILNIDPEDESDTFLRLSLNYTLLQPRRLYSS